MMNVSADSLNLSPSDADARTQQAQSLELPLRALLAADIDRYRSEGKVLWHEPSLWAVFAYRFSRWTRQRRGTAVGVLCTPIDAVLYPVISLLTGIQIGRGASIGPGLRIWHFGGVIINTHVTIGARCTLRHNVTIGNRRNDFDVPCIGDDVSIGVGATVIGSISVGDRAVIGAGAVVLHDVPAGQLAVGNPARVIARSDS